MQDIQRHDATLGNPPPLQHDRIVPSLFGNLVIIALLVFLASWLGIISRPQNQLSAFWPTNALLLGTFIRTPGLTRHPACWLVACVAYIAADLLSGNLWTKTLWLTSANLSGVIAGVLLFRPILGTDAPDALSEPSSMLRLLLLCCVSALASALTGSLLAPALIGTNWLREFGFWFSAELVSYLLLLPMLLLAPPLSRLRRETVASLASIRKRPRNMLPLLLLLLSVLLAFALDGPGAIVFSVPALIWCALTYRIFTTSLAITVVCIWTMLAAATGDLAIHASPDNLHDTISFRIGVALLAVAPLTVAAIDKARNRLLETVHHAASHDALTGVLNRGAFLLESRKTLDALSKQGLPATLMLVDIDHFKQVNDRHGHAAGDTCLSVLARRMQTCMRPEDLLARFGGEEFAVLLSDVTPGAAVAIADQLRHIVSTDPVLLEGGLRLTLTISIGSVSVHTGDAEPLPLETLLKRADEALYRAKANGRNRIEQSLA